MCKLLEKDCQFYFDELCVKSFGEIIGKLVSAPIIISLCLNIAFEVMCDASGVYLGVVLGKRKKKILQPIYYTSKALNEAQKSCSRIVVHTDHSTLRYLIAKQDSEPRLIH